MAIKIPNRSEGKNAYLKDWDEIIAKAEELTGLKVCAFDPNIVFAEGNKEVHLPLWFLDILIERMK